MWREEGWTWEIVWTVLGWSMGVELCVLFFCTFSCFLFLFSFFHGFSPMPTRISSLSWSLCTFPGFFFTPLLIFYPFDALLFLPFSFLIFLKFFSFISAHFFSSPCVVVSWHAIFSFPLPSAPPRVQVSADITMTGFRWCSICWGFALISFVDFWPIRSISHPCLSFSSKSACWPTLIQKGLVFYELPLLNP